MKTAAMLALLAAACLAVPAAGQPFLPGSGFAPLGNLRTTDQDGPYNLTLLTPQVAEIQAGLAARKDYTAKDIFNFLTNVECLEGQFDTWGTFGRGFLGDLALGGPTPIGARKANLTNATLPFLEEVALNEQGHALLTRQAGSVIPCPLIDFDGGFNAFFAAAYQLNGTVKEKYGVAFDPFKNDVNFVLSVLSLEELGATGNKGLALLVNNPVHANAIAGLATSATAQATVERFLLYQLRNEIVEPFGETAQQAFARVSAYRDRMDGPQFDDQGIVNTDPRNIAVPEGFVNLIPTDYKGLTFSRTPQQNINILTIGSPNGKGGFFPNGLIGRINKPTGYNKTALGLDKFPRRRAVSGQQSIRATGKLPKPVTAAGPRNVTGEEQLTQSFDGPLTTAGPENRGLKPVPARGSVNERNASVVVGTPGGRKPSRSSRPSKGRYSGRS